MTRVPEFLMFHRSQDSITQVREKMMKNQEQAVTGKRVNRASDDPVSAMRTVGVRVQQQRDDQVSQNLEMATSIVNITDSSLGELGDILVRAKELAVQMSSTSNNNDDARGAVSKEVEQLKLRAIQIGNARLGDRYVFGGFTTDRPPFDEHGNYFGDDGVTQLEVDRGQRIAINIPGITPFFGLEQLPDPTFKNDPMHGANDPNIPGDLRSPASLLAARKNIPAVDSDPQFRQIQQTSGVNLFGVLQEFSDGLASGNIKRVQNSIDGLDSSFKQVLQSRALVGARQNALKMSQESVEGAKEANANLIASTEDADLLKVYSDISKNENSLKAALEMNKKILTPSLLEFLK